MKKIRTIFHKKTLLFSLIWMFIGLTSLFIHLYINNEKSYSYILFLIAFGISIPPFLDYKKLFQIKNWTNIKGKVVNISIESHIEIGRSDVNPPVFFPVITYEYIYNNLKYKSHKFSIIDDDYKYIFEEDVKKIIKNISLYSEIVVFINPKDPSQALINKKISKELLFNNISYNFLSLAFIIMGIYLWN